MSENLAEKITELCVNVGQIYSHKVEVKELRSKLGRMEVNGAPSSNNKQRADGETEERVMTSEVQSCFVRTINQDIYDGQEPHSKSSVISNLVK